MITRKGNFCLLSSNTYRNITTNKNNSRNKREVWEEKKFINTCKECVRNFFFFTPIPCTYTSSPLDGMARNYIIIFLSTWIRKITQFIVSGSILFLPPYTRGEKKHLV